MVLWQTNLFHWLGPPGRISKKIVHVLSVLCRPFATQFILKVSLSQPVPKSFPEPTTPPPKKYLKNYNKKRYNKWKKELIKAFGNLVTR